MKAWTEINGKKVEFEISKETEKNFRQALNERWKPKFNEEYWFVNSSGVVCFKIWKNTIRQNWRYEQDNCFETEEEAIEHKKELEFYAEWNKWIKENDNDRNFIYNKKSQTYELYYSNNKIAKHFYIYDDYCHNPSLCFSTKELQDEFIKAFEQDLLKYYFKIKDNNNE